MSQNKAKAKAKLLRPMSSTKPKKIPATVAKAVRGEIAAWSPNDANLDWEREVFDRIADMDPHSAIEVEKMPLEQMLWMRMMPNECHQNAHYYVANDPEQGWEHVLGWVPRPSAGSIVLEIHSVVRHKATGGYRCVTPFRDVTGGYHDRPILFLPDPALHFPVDADGNKSGLIMLNDKPLKMIGVRADPSSHMAHLHSLIGETV